MSGMKINGILGVLLMLLISSCICNRQSMGVGKMTNADLHRLIAGKEFTLPEFIRVVHLERFNDLMIPDSSPEFLTYRFLIGNRALFLKVNRSNSVRQAFFADDSIPLATESVEHMTNADLDRLIARKNRAFDDVFRELHLEHSEGLMEPGGSVELTTFAFAVGKRHLLLEVLNRSNIVNRAYFADDSIRRVPASQSVNTNKVRKPQ